MATEHSPEEYADWRTRQKERERERRRMRDRQRRQTMSIEEREKHLARRRRNYQLRRQRAANAQLGFQHTNMNISNVSAGVELDIQNDSLAFACVSKPRLHSNYEMQDGFDEPYKEQNDLVTKCDGETTHHESYTYPRIPRLNQIKQFARRLGSSVDKSSLDSQGIGAHVINEEMLNPLRKCRINFK